MFGDLMNMYGKYTSDIPLQVQVQYLRFHYLRWRYHLFQYRLRALLHRGKISLRQGHFLLINLYFMETVIKFGVSQVLFLTFLGRYQRTFVIFYRVVWYV